MRQGWLLRTTVIAASSLWVGCPGGDDDDDGTGASEDGGQHHVGGSSGSAGSTAGRGGSGGRSGSGGMGSSGSGAVGTTGGSSGGGGSDCPDQIPAICRLCDDGGCGEPVCTDGSWRFACPEDSEDGGTGSELHWYTTCGDPICTASDEPYDDPAVPNCTDEQPGDPCSDADARCDGVASCGAVLLCTDSDPTMRPGGCPISRARFKQDIAYLDPQQLRAYHEQLVHLPLASWRYRSAPQAAPQLGFIIDDIEPSAAVSGDHVNMYGYLSMAVAAIQVQQAQIDALQAELQAMRERAAASSQAICGP